MICARNPHLLSRLFWLVSSLRILRITFDPDQCRINLAPVPSNASWSKLRCYLVSLLVAGLVIQWAQNKGSTSENVVVGLELTVLLTGYPYIYEGKKATEISFFFNSLFQFDFMHSDASQKTKMSFRVKMSIAFVYCALGAATGLPVGFAHGLHWINPCKPGLMGYWLIPECWSTIENWKSMKGAPNILIKCFILGLNHWVGSVVLHAAVFGIAGIHTMGVIAIHQFIQRWRKIILLYLVNKSKNKNKFRLNCRFRRNFMKHDNIRSCVIKEAPIYRQIEVIANLCNEIQQKAQLPTIIAGSIATLSISMAFLVQTPATQQNIPPLLLMLLAGANASLFLIFCVSGLAQVYRESSKALEDIKLYLAKASQIRERRWLKRFVKSCGIIKMKFGGNNFVEELTPLSCISHAIELSVQILLLGRNH